MKIAWNCEPTKDAEGKWKVVQVYYRGTDLQMNLTRCPAWYVRNEPWVADAIGAYFRWRDKNILPFAGGYEDQPRNFHRICDILDVCFAAMRGKDDG